jgi:hypothetical protein
VVVALLCSTSVVLWFANSLFVSLPFIDLLSRCRFARVSCLLLLSRLAFFHLFSFLALFLF